MAGGGAVSRGVESSPQGHRGVLAPEGGGLNHLNHPLAPALLEPGRKRIHPRRIWGPVPHTSKVELRMGPLAPGAELSKTTLPGGLQFSPVQIPFPHSPGWADLLWRGSRTEETPNPAFFFRLPDPLGWMEILLFQIRRKRGRSLSFPRRK